MAQRPVRSWLLEQGVVFGAIAALVILIVLPLGSLLLGSVFGDTGFTFDNFARALANRLYYEALINSLILGFWTGLFSVLIGVPLAWAVSRTNLPGKGFVRLTASIAYLSPPFLVAIAYVNLFGPNAGIVNVFIHDVLGLPSLTFNIFSMTGLVFVTVPHTFPFVYLLAVSALQSVDASLEESAQILGAGRMRTALTVTLPLVAPAILSGALIGFVNAIALFGSQAIIGLPARIFTLPTRIYALFDYPPQYGLASALSLLFVAITVAALYLQRAYLARRSYVTLGGKGVRLQPVDLGWVRWLLLLFCLLVFVITILLPYAALVAVSFSKSWGLAFWQNLTLDNYRFVLLDYDVTRRAIVNSLVLATLAAESGRRHGGDHRLDRSAHAPPLPAGHRLCLARAAGPAGHRHGGGHSRILAAPAGEALWHAGHSAARLLGPLHPARRARRQRVAAPDRARARRKRAHSRRILGPDDARDHAAADAAGALCRLDPGLRSGDPGIIRLHPALQLEFDHLGGRRLQPL